MDRKVRKIRQESREINKREKDRKEGRKIGGGKKKVKVRKEEKKEGRNKEGEV